MLFYLIEPAYRQIADAKAYLGERPKVQEAFVTILNQKSEAQYSLSFRAYVASFSLLIWFAATGVILSIFYVTVKIRTRDGRVLSLPSEDAHLCLTYAFVTLMMWIPFRMNTVYIKKL